MDHPMGLAFSSEVGTEEGARREGVLERFEKGKKKPKYKHGTKRTPCKKG